MIVKFAIVALFFVSFVGISYSDLEDMGSFLPAANHLSSNWQLSDIEYVEDTDVSPLEETSDAVLRQYAFRDMDNDSYLLVTMSIFEFSSEKTTINVHDDYIEKLEQQDFDVIQINDETGSECFGVIKNTAMQNEAASISCAADEFLVISTTEQQNGDVYENGNRLFTARVSAGFVEFTIKAIQDSQTPIVPDWLRTNAKWWSMDLISDNEFVNAIEFLIEEGLVKVPEGQAADVVASTHIPSWIKNNAKLWSDGLISDEEFVSGIQYLIQQGIVQV